jgi:ATP-binding cassette subfamily F protein 3
VRAPETTWNSRTDGPTGRPAARAGKSLLYYPGNLDAAMWQREEKQKRMATAQATLDRQRKHMADTVQKLESAARKGDQKKSSQVASRRKKLDRHGLDKTLDGKKWKVSTMGPRFGSVDAVKRGGWIYGFRQNLMEAADPPSRIALPEPSALQAHVLLELARMSCGYVPGKNVLTNVTLNVEQGGRYGLLGRNGVGKSTLLGVLVGELEPSEGLARRAPGLKVAHFKQHHIQLLDPALTPVEFVRASIPACETDQDARAVLGRFGLSGDAPTRPIGTLSGGQKSRVVLTVIVDQCPQLLILDEITNHLDMDTVAALAEVRPCVLCAPDHPMVAACRHWTSSRAPLFW